MYCWSLSSLFYLISGLQKENKLENLGQRIFSWKKMKPVEQKTSILNVSAFLQEFKRKVKAYKFNKILQFWKGMYA